MLRLPSQRVYEHIWENTFFAFFGPKSGGLHRGKTPLESRFRPSSPRCSQFLGSTPSPPDCAQNIPIRAAEGALPQLRAVCAQLAAERHGPGPASHTPVLGPFGADLGHFWPVWPHFPLIWGSTPLGRRSCGADGGPSPEQVFF